jgi:hypothetical protein
MKVLWVLLSRLQLVVSVVTSKCLCFETGFSLFASHANLLVFICLILEALLAHNSSVSFTFGVGVVQIGSENFKIGRGSVSNLGQLLVLQKKRVHLGMSAMQQGQPKPILRKDKAPSRNLSFADSIEYTACKGYQNPKFTAGVVLPPTHCTSTLPSLKFGSAKPFEFTQDKLVQPIENNHNTSSPISVDQQASSIHNVVPSKDTDHASTSGTK